MVDVELESDWDDAPYVCPGCHAVGEEPCHPGCIDAAMADADEERRELYGYDDEDEPTAPGVNEGSDEQLAALAELEAETLEPPSLDQTGLLPLIDGLDQRLGASDDHPGARSCVWCRSSVLDDFDHDFCEPEEPTAVMDRRDAFRASVGIVEGVEACDIIIPWRQEPN